MSSKGGMGNVRDNSSITYRRVTKDYESFTECKLIFYFSLKTTLYLYNCKYLDLYARFECFESAHGRLTVPVNLCQPLTSSPRIQCYKDYQRHQQPRHHLPEPWGWEAVTQRVPGVIHKGNFVKSDIQFGTVTGGDLYLPYSTVPLPADYSQQYKADSGEQSQHVQSWQTQF